MVKEVSGRDLAGTPAACLLSAVATCPRPARRPTVRAGPSSSGILAVERQLVFLKAAGAGVPELCPRHVWGP